MSRAPMSRSTRYRGDPSPKDPVVSEPPNEQEPPESRTEQEPAAERDLFGRTPKGRKDWSHRKGEPRGLALAWSLVMLGVAGWSFAASSGAGGVSTEAYRVRASHAAVLLALAVGVLWPMMRLSQVRPRRGVVRSVLVDAMVLLGPMQVMIWPQFLLAGWSVTRCAAVAGVMTGWVIGVGAVIAAGVSSQRTVWRGAAMATVLAMALSAPVSAVLWGLDESSSRSWVWLSPLSAMFELTRDLTWEGGRPYIVETGVWRGVAGSVVGALVVWTGLLGWRMVRDRADA